MASQDVLYKSLLVLKATRLRYVTQYLSLIGPWVQQELRSVTQLLDVVGVTFRNLVTSKAKSPSIGFEELLLSPASYRTWICTTQKSIT